MGALGGANVRCKQAAPDVRAETAEFESGAFLRVHFQGKIILNGVFLRFKGFPMGFFGN